MTYWSTIELLFAAALTAGGSFAVSVAGVRGLATPFLGIAVGMSFLVGIGFLQIMLGVSISVPLTLMLVLLLPAILVMLVPADERLYVVFVVVAGTFFATVFVAAGFTVFDRLTYIKHVDTMEYLTIGSMIFNDNFEKGVSQYQLQKRMFAVPFLHFSANLADQYYLRSVGPLAALSTCGSLAWLVVRGLRARDVLSPPLLAILAVAALLAMNRFWMHTFYINAHLVVALWFLLLSGSGWLLAVDRDVPPKAIWLIQFASIVGLVLARPEGFILAGLALLPTLVTTSVSDRYKISLWLAFLMMVAAWHGYFADSFPRWIARNYAEYEVYGPLIAAVIGLAATPLLVARRFKNVRMLLLPLVLSALWLSLIALALWRPNVIQKSIASIYLNIETYWGYAFLLIAILSVACVIFKDFAGRRLLSFPILSFIALLLLLAYLRGGGYRVGGGDSANRIMFHIVPLMILTITASAGTRWTLPKFRSASRQNAKQISSPVDNERN